MDAPTRGMQRHILAAILQDHALFAQVSTILRPELFSDDATSDVIAWTLDQYRKHRQVPSKVAILDVFKEESRQMVVKRAYETAIPDGKYTVERLVEYAQDRALRGAVSEIAEHMHLQAQGTPQLDKRGNPVEMDYVAKIRDALAVGSAHKRMGVALSDVIEHVAARALNPVAVERFTTGSEHLNEAGMMLGRGEIGCVLARSKGGKSQLLLNIALANAIDGKTVIYYNVEIREARLEDRFGKRLAGANADMDADPAAFVEKMRERYKKLVTGEVYLEHYVAGQQSFDDIRANLAAYRARGVKPDMIVVDYVGIMRTPVHYTEKRHVLGQLWQDFRAVCAEENVAGWGAAQANRIGAQSEVARDTDIGESYEIISHLDAGVTVNINDEEMAQGVGRLFVMASRNGRTGSTIAFKHDFSRSIIKTTGFVDSAVIEKKERTPSEAEDVEASQHAKAIKRRKSKKTTPEEATTTT